MSLRDRALEALKQKARGNFSWSVLAEKVLNELVDGPKVERHVVDESPDLPAVAPPGKTLMDVLGSEDPPAKAEPENATEQMPW